MAETDSRSHLLSNKQYNTAKFLAGIVIPSIGTLYFALADIWGLPAATQVLGSLLAFQAFLGALLGISSISYETSDARYSGNLNVSETPEKVIYSLDLNHAPELLIDQDEAIFKIKANPPAK